MGYKDIISYTIKNYVKDKYKKILVGRLRTEKILFTDSRISKKGQEVISDRLDCSAEGSNTSILIKCLNEKENELINILEEFEYYKGYKYATIYSCSEIEEKILRKLIEDKKVNQFRRQKDICNKVISNPTVRNKEEKYMFKFSLLRRSKLFEDPQEEYIKYTILAIYYKELGIFEIRVDDIPSKYRNDDYFYANQVKSVVAWFRENLEITLSTLNYRYIIEKIKNSYEGKISSCMVSMNTQNKSKATLTAAIGDEPILPILGELKELLSENEEIFNEESKARVILEEFIDNIESTSDLPREALFWHDTKEITEFIYDYKGNDFCMLCYRGREQSTRRMEDVARLLIENQENIE